MGSEALELALAVYRTPIKRHALYDMALPCDIGLVLQLASAPQPLLSEVAAEVDESEDTIVEASRFYLQLALFQTDADAYRVLGLADDATHERIREHYRWLQRWVHPDRRGEDWEALFATRVNWAWSNLRNETVRRAYDIENDRSMPAHTEPADEPGVRPEWNPSIAHTHRASRAGQIVFGLLLCSCIALLYMVITRDDGVAPDETGTQAAANDSSTAPPADLRVSSPGSSASTPLSEAPVHGQPGRDTRQIVNGGGGTKGDDETFRLADPHEIEHVAQAPASRAASAENNLFPKPLLPRAAPDGSGMTGVPGHGGAAPEAGKSIATVREPKPVDEPKAAADTSGKNAKDHGNNAAPVDSGAAEQVASTAVAAEKISNSRSPSAPATSPAAVEHLAAAAQSTPDKTNLSARESGVDDALARIDLAHQRVKELSTFFAKLDSRSPPIWNDVAGQSSAEAQRSALYDRAGPRDQADFVVDDPRWRMSEKAAALSANYHLLKRNAVSESGRISLSMVWRERMWLVTQVELRPTL